MAKLQMMIRVGRSAGRFDAKDSRASQFVADTLAETVVNGTRANVRVDFARLQKTLESAVNSELANAVRYASNNLIGLETARGVGRDGVPPVRNIYIAGVSQAEAAEGMRPTMGVSRARVFPAGSPFRNSGSHHVLQWHGLTGRTIRAKTQNKLKHFLHTGALRQVLRQNARSIAAGTGAVKVEYLAANGKWSARARSLQGKKVPVGKLRLTFLPRIHRSVLPGLHSGSLTSVDRSMRFEAMLGLPDDAWEKLRGPKAKSGFQRPEWHRPLLQPVFTYWTLFRLPARVEQVLNRIL